MTNPKDAVALEEIEMIELCATKLQYITPTTSRDLWHRCAALRTILELPQKERPSEPLTKQDKKKLG